MLISDDCLAPKAADTQNYGDKRWFRPKNTAIATQPAITSDPRAVYLPSHPTHAPCMNTFARCVIAGDAALGVHVYRRCR